MTFTFDVGTPIDANVQRLLGRQITKSRQRLRGVGDLDQAVHETRKSCKRSRALVRLIETALPSGVARDLGRGFRDVGRLLAGARDRNVLAATATAIGAHFDSPDAAEVRSLSRVIEDRFAGDEAGSEAALPLGEARARLKALANQIADLRIAIDGPKPLIASYIATYGKGRDEFRHCYKAGSDEDFHDWRKSVQMHWRQSTLLRELWPDMMDARAETARRLSQALGQDHDLSALIAVIEQAAPRILDRKIRHRLVARCRAMQRDLRHVSQPTAARLYAVPPKALAAELKALWSAVEVA